MSDRELRLRKRIDVLTGERDQAVAERDRAVSRCEKAEKLARQLAERLNRHSHHHDADELRRRLYRVVESRSRARKSRDMWRTRAYAAEWALRQRTTIRGRARSVAA